MSEVDNETRAAWGQDAVNIQITNAGDAGDLETNAGDLIANILHYAAKDDLMQAGAIMRRAVWHFEEEVAEECEEGDVDA